MGGVIYWLGQGTLSCGIPSEAYDGSTIGTGTVPPGCTKVVSVPLLGEVSSVVTAAAIYGAIVALVVFVVAFAVLAWRDTRARRAM